VITNVTIIIELHPLLFLIIMKSLNSIYNNMDIKFNKTQNLFIYFFFLKELEFYNKNTQ